MLFWPFFLVNLLTRPFPWMIRWPLRLLGYPLGLMFYGVFVLAALYGLRAQTYDLSRIHTMPARSVIRDRLGEEIGRIHGEKRSIVPLHQVAESFRLAIIAREDERFYQFRAIDPIGIGRAALMNLQGKREGASTITQQLASDIFQLKRGESRDNLLRMLDRKCLEIAIAFRLEAALTKDEILQAYINQINWGRQIRGIGEASRIYFEKHPAELTLSESALLAGIVRGPDSFNPFRSIDAARRERDTTLARMVSAGSVSAEQAAAAKQEPIRVRPPARRESRESYALDAIRADLEIILEKQDIELGGLEIITTIDNRLQQKASEALEQRLAQIERTPGYPHQTRAAWNRLPQESRSEPKYLQGSVVVVENRTGAVLALVGGRDANESRFNRAKDAHRQLGSIFKPFVYLAAFDRGLRADSMVDDGPIRPGEIRGGGKWRPQNSDNTFGGVMPAAYGLVRSRNTMSVRVGNFAGLDQVKATAASAGFMTPMPTTPTAFLGAWEGTPWEVATAFSIFPNEGLRFRPFLISEIKDREGNVLYSTLPLRSPAASSGSAWSVSRILNEVTTRGTAAAVRRLGFDKPCGGKTGTTNDFKDAWFAGYTSNLTCVVWSGFDSPKQILNGAFGSVVSLPVWVEVMKTADRLGYQAGQLHSHLKLVRQDLCRLSGKRATSGCRAAETAFTDEVAPDTLLPENDLCPLHPARALSVDESSLAATPLPPRALPVEENLQEEADIAPPPKALPVEEP